MEIVICFLALILQSQFSDGFIRHKIHISPIHPTDCTLEDALLLTPLLKKGKFKEAVRLAKVEPSIGNVTSYSGFLTVHEKCNSNLFFWFFPAQKKTWKDAPLLLWLQGGPGATSMYGLFEELGPFKITERGVERRKYSWNIENNLLFIDQPVGTGFSFTTDECYATNEEEVGLDLYSAILQFYQLFPQLRKNKFFISGESYAGHYIPALGYTIHKYNPTAKIKIKLAAMIIGNGWVDPKTQNDYGENLYQLGLLDSDQRDLVKETDKTCKTFIEDEDWFPAFIVCHESLGSLYDQFVGDVNVYNYLQNSLEDSPYFGKYLQSCKGRRALHLGNHTFNDGSSVFENLLEDTLQSVKPWVEELLEHYPIIFFNGQLDIICAYPMSSKVINSLKWSGQEKFLKSSRSKWCVGQEPAGYFKGKHHLYDVLVRGAGHMVPTDQPLWAYTLINSITSGPPDNPFHALEKCREW